jgi:hypothetical protein
MSISEFFVRERERLEKSCSVALEKMEAALKENKQELALHLQSELEPLLHRKDRVEEYFQKHHKRGHSL